MNCKIDISIMIKSFVEEMSKTNSIIKEGFSKIYDEVFSETILNNYDEHYILNKITDHNSIKSIIYKEGFYVIFTSHYINNNECKLSIKKCAAIYRGEGMSVRRRIESHLFNKIYRNEYEKRKERCKGKFTETDYKVCLSIKENERGINLNEESYNADWYVATLKLPKSSSAIRKQAEVAFDEKYNRPICSKK